MKILVISILSYLATVGLCNAILKRRNNLASDNNNISSITIPSTNISSPPNAISWPKVPPSFSYPFASDPYILTFSLVNELSSSQPRPQPSDLRNFILSFHDNLAENITTYDFTPQRAGQDYIDLDSFTKVEIVITRLSWFGKTLPTYVVLEGLDALAGLVHNRVPADLGCVIQEKDADGKKGGEFFKIRLDITRFALMEEGGRNVSDSASWRNKLQVL